MYRGTDVDPGGSASMRTRTNWTSELGRQDNFIPAMSHGIAQYYLAPPTVTAINICSVKECDTLIECDSHHSGGFL
jgi:hypothetical protein